jgi:hypothetical protein
VLVLQYTSHITAGYNGRSQCDKEALKESASFRAHWFSLFMSESDKFELVGEMNLILSCGAMKFGYTQLSITP